MDPRKMSQGCCGGEAGVNFSLLEMPDIMAINLASYMLWGTALIMFLEPNFKPLIVIQEKKYGLLSFYLGQSVTFFAYVLTSYLYSIWTFLIFHNTLFVQPRSPELQRNDVLMVGYGLVLVAVVVKMYCYQAYGMAHIMGGKHFNVQLLPDPSAQGWPDVYYHPVGTASILFYLGCALIRASEAGLCLSLVLGLGCYCGWHMERCMMPESSRGPTDYPAKLSLGNMQSHSIILHLLRKIIPVFKGYRSKKD